MSYRALTVPLAESNITLCSLALKKGFARNEDPTISVSRVLNRIEELDIIKNDTTIVLLEPMYDDFGDRYLFVWTIFTFQGTMDLSVTIAAIVKHATLVGCKYVEFFTQRPGWDKLLSSEDMVSFKGTIHRKYM